TAEMSALRTDHAATVAILNEQIKRLQDDLDRTRLFLNPGLAPSDSNDSEPPAAPPEEQLGGTPFQKLLRRAQKAYDANEQNAREVHAQPRKRKKPEAKSGSSSEVTAVTQEGAS